MKKFIFLIIFLVSHVSFLKAEFPNYISVKKFGAVADARKVNNKWIGTDNSIAFNQCAAYCRKNGNTMYIPKGDYGVASTVWLTNPEIDGHKQASITMVGPNLGAYRNQSDSANICVLQHFKAGKIINVKKDYGFQNEPDIIPTLGISNGRQVHIRGIGIKGNNLNDLVCGIAIGNVSWLVSVRNSSIYGTYAGVVFPGIRSNLKNNNIIEGDNNLLVIEQCTFDNIYNIVCGGTQPYSCEYRSNRFVCSKSVFTGTLVTNEFGHSRGSHKFSSNLFGSDEKSTDIVYFDLHLNEVTIDSSHFEPGFIPDMPQTLIRCIPNGGVRNRGGKLSFTNNIVNFRNMKKSPAKFRPLFDTMIGNRMVVQGNTFRLGGATRIKAYGAVFVGNVFKLYGETDVKVNLDAHLLAGKIGNIMMGEYDFNHFIRADSIVEILLEDKKKLTPREDFNINKQANTFTITKKGKQKIDKSNSNYVYITYEANDASEIRFLARGHGQRNPPHGWESRDLTMISNKLVYRYDNGNFLEKELIPILVNKNDKTKIFK